MTTKHANEHETGYPRIYRVDRRTRRSIYGFAAFLVGLLLICTAVGWARHPEGFRGTGSVLSAILMNVLIDASGVAACLRVSGRVVLYEDAIELMGPFRRRTLKRNEIRGWRMHTSHFPVDVFSYIFLPSDKREKPLRLPPYLHVDKFFYAWRQGIPKIETRRR